MSKAPAGRLYAHPAVLENSRTLFAVEPVGPVHRVMRRFNLPSKRAAVDLALRRLLGEPMTRDEILALQGVGWSGDAEAVRRAEHGELG